jgi:hypothetical protein
MAHDFKLPGATVYVWEPKGILRGTIGSWWGSEGSRVGHAAIKISDGGSQYIYVSFWPANNQMHLPTSPSTSQEKAGALFDRVLGHVDDTSPREHRLLRSIRDVHVSNVTDGDSDHENGKPTVKFRFLQGLNWKAMISAGGRIKAECRNYDIHKKNCCHAVANVLAAGNPPVAVPLTGYITNVWQPGDVIAYCRRLVTSLNNTYPNSAQEKAGGVWS